MKKSIDHWFNYFENFHPHYIIMSKESSNSSVSEESRFIAVMTPPGFSHLKKLDVISMQASKVYISVFFLNDSY